MSDLKEIIINGDSMEFQKYLNTIRLKPEDSYDLSKHLARTGRKKFIQLLLDKHPSYRDFIIKGGLLGVAEYGRIDILEYLIDLGVPLLDLESPLAVASINGYLNIVQYLIEHDVPHSSIQLAIDRAFQYRRYEILDYLFSIIHNHQYLI